MTTTRAAVPGTRNSGFTLIEVLIVVGLLATLVSLAVPPVLNALSLATRESAMLQMDRDGHRALNLITADIRPAILPITTRDRQDYTPGSALEEWAVESGEISFQDVLNSPAGFTAHGEDWLRVLTEGTDFLPFTQPVPFEYTAAELPKGGEITTKSTLDSNFLPHLGVRDFSSPGSARHMGAISVAGQYQIVSEPLDNGTESLHRYLRDARQPNVFTPIHPYLQALQPEDVGLNPNGLPENLELGDARYAENLVLPNGADTAYGVIRFVPYRDGNQQPRRIKEAELGMDMNGDGDADDEFALGRLEIIYLARERGDTDTRQVRRSAATSTVLLQTNTTEKAKNEYPALFRLRKPKVTAGDQTTSYALDINLLLMDDLRQKSSVLSFNQAVPFIIRRYQTTVELRNLVIR